MAKVSKSILFVEKQAMINNNCQEYDFSTEESNFSMESLLLRCNKLFHFVQRIRT